MTGKSAGRPRSAGRLNASATHSRPACRRALGGWAAAGLLVELRGCVAARWPAALCEHPLPQRGLLLLTAVIAVLCSWPPARGLTCQSTCTWTTPPVAGWAAGATPSTSHPLSASAASGRRGLGMDRLVVHSMDQAGAAPHDRISFWAATIPLLQLCGGGAAAHRRCHCGRPAPRHPSLGHHAGRDGGEIFEGAARQLDSQASWGASWQWR